MSYYADSGPEDELSDNLEPSLPRTRSGSCPAAAKQSPIADLPELREEREAFNAELDRLAATMAQVSKCTTLAHWCTCCCVSLRERMLSLPAGAPEEASIAGLSSATQQVVDTP